MPDAPDDVAALRAENGRLRGENARLRTQNDELQERIARVPAAADLAVAKLAHPDGIAATVEWIRERAR